jgi:hypothetical protein
MTSDIDIIEPIDRSYGARRERHQEGERQHPDDHVFDDH